MDRTREQEIAHARKIRDYIIERGGVSEGKVMNLRELTREWLQQHGYDGLCHVAAECGCHADDLMPCSEPGIDCQPGHLAPCDCGVHDYHLTPRRKWTANPIGRGEETTP